MRHGQCYSTAEHVVDADASFALNFLLGTFLVLLTHVHDRCSRRPVQFITVETLEFLLDLVCHPAVLSHSLLRDGTK